MPKLFPVWLLAMVAVLAFAGAAFAQSLQLPDNQPPMAAPQPEVQPEAITPDIAPTEAVTEDAVPLVTDPTTGEQHFDAGEVVEDVPDIQEEYVPPAVTEEDAAPLDGASTPAPMVVHAAKLRALNKITAKSQEMEVLLGATAYFGRLELLVHQCWQAPPMQRPENAALLEMWEQKPEEGQHKIFKGWMFSSSPSLSSLEHPVYDITVVECLKKPVDSGGF